jgi:hypothetical protein
MDKPGLKHKALCGSLLIFSFVPCAGDTIPAYHLRSDQVAQLNRTSSSDAACWSEWNQRVSIDSTVPRYIRVLSRNDGNVSLHVQAGSSFSTLYLHIRLAYSTKAPSTESLDIPIDGLIVSWAGDSLGKARLGDLYQYYDASIVLSDEQGNVAFRKYEPGSSSGYSYDGLCARVIEIDERTKAAEIAIPWVSLYVATPTTGIPRVFDIRYCTATSAITLHAFRKDQFDPEAVDTICSRIFIGNQIIDPTFFDSVIVITSPPGNANWIGGSLYTLTWGTTVQGGTVGLEYSTDGGGVWNNIIAATADDGAYPWQLPLLSSNRCQVRIYGAVSKTMFDTSGVFSIGYPVPVLIPAPDTVIAGLPLLQWLQIKGASRYRIMVGTDIKVTHAIIDDTVQGITQYIASQTVPSANYFWKVSSNLDFSLFSSVDSFFVVGSGGIPLVAGHEHVVPEVQCVGRDIHVTVKIPSVFSMELIDMAGRVLGAAANVYRMPGLYIMHAPFSAVPRVCFVRVRSESWCMVTPYFYPGQRLIR